MKSVSSAAWDRTLLVIFGLALFAPVVGMWARIGQVESQDEKRAFAVLPKLGSDPRSWSALAATFPAYFRDHFGFRQWLLEARAIVEVRALGQSTSSYVVVGKRGWLYYKGERTMESYTGSNPFTPEELNQWIAVLGRMNSYLAARSSRFVVVIPPDKQTIYPEHLPSAFRRGSFIRFDAIEIRLRQAGIDHIDLVPDLEAAKTATQLFFKTDTHWNADGAFVAYQTIMRHMSAFFPRSSPHPRSYFTPVHRRYTGDLNSMLGLKYPREDFISLVDARDPSALTGSGKNIFGDKADPSLPRLLILGDSFAAPLVSMLATHFSRIVFVWDNTFDPVLVEREKPDVVIWELVERRLGWSSVETFFRSQ